MRFINLAPVSEAGKRVLKLSPGGIQHFVMQRQRLGLKGSQNMGLFAWVFLDCATESDQK